MQRLNSPNSHQLLCSSTLSATTHCSGLWLKVGVYGETVTEIDNSYAWQCVYVLRDCQTNKLYIVLLWSRRRTYNSCVYMAGWVYEEFEDTKLLNAHYTFAATPKTSKGKQSVVWSTVLVVGLPSGIQIFFYYPIPLGYLYKYLMNNGCKFHWPRNDCRLGQWKVYRFGTHNNYSNVLSLNINTSATCRVLSMGTPVPASTLVLRGGPV